MPPLPITLTPTLILRCCRRLRRHERMIRHARTCHTPRYAPRCAHADARAAVAAYAAAIKAASAATPCDLFRMIRCFFAPRRLRLRHLPLARHASPRRVLLLRRSHTG